MPIKIVKKFTKTSAGEIPEDWESVCLQEVIVDMGDGGTPDTTCPEYFNGTINWATIEDVVPHIIATQQKISELGLKKSSAKLWPPQTIILTTGATIGKVGIAEIPLATKQGITGIIPKVDRILPEFLKVFLGSKEKFLNRIAQGSTIKEVRAPILLKLNIPLPRVKEQKKIGEIFAAVDEVMVKTQKTIEQAQSLKKGLMQELFTKGLTGKHKKFKKTKIGKIPIEWKIVPIGAVLKDLSYGMSVKCSYKESKYPVLRIPNVISGKINFNDLKYTDIGSAQAQQYKLVQNDVLLVRTNGNPNFVGRAALVPKMSGDWLFASYLIRLRFLTEKIHPVYGYYALNSPGTRKLLEKGIRTSAGNYNLNGPGIKSTPIALPSLDEQLAITTLIDTIESKVLCDIKYLAWLEQVKSSLVQVLLTGKVRVAL